MIVEDQIIVIFFIFCIAFICIRGFLTGVKSYQLNKSALKKRRKSESFKERMLYSKFKEEIPKALLLLYFSILIVHPVAIVVCILLRFIDTDISFNIGGIIAKTIFYFDIAWMLIIMLLFWTPGTGFAYERWITRNRGQKKSSRTKDGKWK